jgi:membrane associated rhomboid family serine protease
MMATSLSRKILIGSMVIFILFLFRILDPLVRYLVLTPESIIPDLQLWRLVTYVLVPGFFSLLIAGICFSVPGEELESMIGTRQFGILLLLVMLGAALMHIALFYGDHQPGRALAGPTNPAVFVLIGFYYLFPHSEIRVLFFNIRSWVLLAIIAALIVAETVYWWSHGATPWLFFSNGGFGLILGAIYFHTRYQKYAFMLRPIRTVERMVEKVGLTSGSRNQPPPRRTASVPYRGPAVSTVRVRNPFQRNVEMNDEERLNSILDRINEKGYDSLSEEEQRFLREYSRKL